MKTEEKPTLIDLDELTLNNLKLARDEEVKKANNHYQDIIKSCNELFTIISKNDNSSKMEYINPFLDNLIIYVTLTSILDELNRNISLLEEVNRPKKKDNNEPKSNDEIMDIDQEGKNNPSKGDNNYNNINSR